MKNGFWIFEKFLYGIKMSSHSYKPACPQLVWTQWVHYTCYIQQRSTWARHTNTRIVLNTCVKNSTLRVSLKNVIFTLKINIFLEFNDQQNGGYLLVPLIFEFKINKKIKKRYDAFYKTPVQISFENHHFLKFKNQRYRNSLVVSLVVEFFKKIIFKEDMTLFLRLR